MSYFRHPKTTNERRASFEAADGVKIRAKRRGRNLPNDWDDKPARRQRSWKRHRRTRWK